MTTLDVKDALHIAQMDRDKWKARAVKLAKILGIRDCDIDSYEPKEQEPCDDAVSIQAVIKLVRRCNSALEEPRIFNSHNSGVVFEQYINELPPVRPQEPRESEEHRDG